MPASGHSSLHHEYLTGRRVSAASVGTAAVIIVLFVSPATHSALGAQAPVRRLATPDAVYAEPFTSISGMRELRDGKVVVSDAIERRLQVVDLRSGQSTPVGRQGAGPHEWGNVSRLYAMPGDSTLMSDFGNGRYFVILPDGKPGPTFRVGEGSPAAFGSLIGVDARGRLLLERQRPGADRMAGSTGIADILRYDRATGRVDTIAQMATPKGEQSGARQLGGGRLQSFTNLPFAATDISANGAALAHDRVAIARAADYHVDWISADGRRTSGPPALPTNIRLTDAEKEAFLKSQVRGGSIITSGPVQSSGGGTAGGGGAASGGAIAINPGDLTDPDIRWPSVKPSFLRGAATLASDGRVWVLRTRAHTDPLPTYDVFDASGKAVERVQLPPRTRLVGFGRGTVYLARTDDDDLQYLERYKLP